jgi:hypothetical protein
MMSEFYVATLRPSAERYQIFLLAYPALTPRRVVRAYGTCRATFFRPLRDWLPRGRLLVPVADITSTRPHPAARDSGSLRNDRPRPRRPGSVITISLTII